MPLVASCSESRDSYGYSRHSRNGRLDYEHKTRRKGELLTLSYMLALTRQHTDQENEYTNTYCFGSLKAKVKKTDHTIANDDVVGGISKGN